MYLKLCRANPVRKVALVVSPKFGSLVSSLDLYGNGISRHLYRRHVEVSGSGSSTSEET